MLKEFLKYKVLSSSWAELVRVHTQVKQIIKIWTLAIPLVLFRDDERTYSECVKIGMCFIPKSGFD